jgi:outer membrane protein TolC
MTACARLCAGLCLILSLGSAQAAGQSVPKASAKDLDLAEAIDLARKNSAPVRATAAAADAALKAVGGARAAWLPKVSASASGAWLGNPPAGVSVAAGSLGSSQMWVPIPASIAPQYYSPTTGYYTGPLLPYTASLPANPVTIINDAKDSYFKGSLTFTQPLLAWGKIAAGVALASLEADLAQVKRTGTELDMVRQVKRSYHAALLARDSSAVLAELCELAASIAEDRARSLEAGATTRSEVLSSKSDLASLEEKLVEAREAEKTALESLAFFMGIGGDGENLRLSSSFPDRLPPIDEAAIKTAAPTVSTDWGTARVRLSQAGRKLDLERGSSILLPNAALFANLGAEGQVIPFSESAWYENTWTWSLSVGVSVQLDLFDGGASFARIGEARAGLIAAKAGLVGAEEGSRLEARNAVAKARRAEADLAAKEARGEWATEKLRAARASFDNELLSRSEFNGAAILEGSVRLELLSARWTLAEAVADLERLAGKELP